MKKIISIKVDVDTFEGMRKGVPALVQLFKSYNIAASFFVPMGKDNTGRTVKRVFRKGFLQKASRVGVVETYGIRTLMYGLVLPGPEIALRNASLLRSVKEGGHEVGIHGLDHVFWHDRIKTLSEEKTKRIIDKAVHTYQEIFAELPRSFAAPGWVTNAHALAYFKKLGFLYTSNTRGFHPFFPVLDGKRFDLPELPSTLPTLDEMVGLAGSDAGRLSDYFVGCLTEGLNILSVHTELEGKKWRPFLGAFIRKSIERGYSYLRLIDVARSFGDSEPFPACRIVFGHVEGRAGEVCLQGSPA
jgi:undecaprenyl phosphate-alpha-L-ara4FN deformylase